jgi:hypothetical protein
VNKPGRRYRIVVPGASDGWQVYSTANVPLLLDEGKSAPSTCRHASDRSFIVRRRNRRFTLETQTDTVQFADLQQHLPEPFDMPLRKYLMVVVSAVLERKASVSPRPTIGDGY